MQIFNPNSLQKQPFKPATNPSHTINMAQHGSKINPKTIAQRLEVNKSRKNPYLLKHSPSSNLRTLLLGSTSSERWNAKVLRKKLSTSFLFLSFFSFYFPFLLFSFFSYFPFLSFPPVLFCHKLVVNPPIYTQFKTLAC